MSDTYEAEAATELNWDAIVAAAKRNERLIIRSGTETIAAVGPAHMEDNDTVLCVDCSPHPKGIARFERCVIEGRDYLSPLVPPHRRAADRLAPYGLRNRRVTRRYGSDRNRVAEVQARRLR